MKAWLSIFFISMLPVYGGAQSEKTKRSIVPHHVKLQFAGTIGFISMGAGYKFAKEKLEGDFFYGYVPKNIGGINIHSVTAKLTWIPVNLKKNKYKFDLLTTGVLVNYAFGKQYDISRASFDYYGFPTAAHVALFAGGGITKNKFGLYYELGTTDREFISFVSNTKGIKFHEIINIGFGARLSLK